MEIDILVMSGLWSILSQRCERAALCEEPRPCEELRVQPVREVSQLQEQPRPPSASARCRVQVSVRAVRPAVSPEEQLGHPYGAEAWPTPRRNLVQTDLYEVLTLKCKSVLFYLVIFKVNIQVLILPVKRFSSL
jgi:hypothetical protein